MFGISGVALGAILRAKGKDYKDILAVAGVYAMIVFLLSAFVLFLTDIGLSDLVSWIPSSILADLTAPLGILIGVVLLGVGAFISMFLGAVILDACEAITKGVR